MKKLEYTAGVAITSALLTFCLFVKIPKDSQKTTAQLIEAPTLVPSTTVELSVDGIVDWVKIPQGERVHIIVNEGKITKVEASL